MTNVTVAEREAVAPQITVRPRINQRLLLLCLIGLALAAEAGWYGYRWWTVGRFIESTDDAYAGGNVTAITPHVGGFVAQIPVDDNERVHAGQVLIRIDRRDYQAALDHAVAAGAQREAALAGLEAKYALQQTEIAQAAADLDAKRAQARFAGQDAARYRELAQTSFGSRQNAERTSAAAATAQSAVKSAEAALVAARQQLTVLANDIAAARAQVAEAKADVETARLNLGYTEIRSPIDGYVGNRAARVGGYVASGAYLMSIIPARGVWVDANFKEDQLSRVRPGQAATIVADAMPGKTFRGHVESLAPATGAVFSVIPPENATGNFTKIVQRVPVRIALDGADTSSAALRPGLSATVSVDTRTGGRSAE